MSKFLKSLCKIAIPVTLQSMLQSSFSIVDQIMIGQLGETNISAVGLCGNFSLIFSVMIGAVSTVAGILIAQFIGAEESKEAWCSFDVSLICGIIMSVLFLLAAGVFPSQILGLYTKDMSIVNTGTVYFRIVALSYIPMAVSNILSSWLRCKEYADLLLAGLLRRDCRPDLQTPGTARKMYGQYCCQRRTDCPHQRAAGLSSNSPLLA